MNGLQGSLQDNMDGPGHKKMARRGSVVPLILRWAVSINTAAGTPQSKRLSLDNTVPLKNKAEEQHRRQSLNTNVERAVAMVNEDPDLDEDDDGLSPFGTRRDSLF
jgi:hypothetical protein